ncbi:MAG: exodeoxyribonuclease III [Syntrophobacteraceae bacterium]|nr:exodeoxyribonuclease III [Syntrophobacteraceae bacterium]
MAWKIATFNVNGIRARLDVVKSWLDQNRPDVLCLQEIKCRDEEFPGESLRELGYEAAVFGQKAFHGVAILSLRSPEEVRRGFGDCGPDSQARLIAAKIDGIWIFNTYVPQGRSPDHPAFQEKLSFFARLKDLFTRNYSPSAPLIWTGDINVAPEDIDVFSPKRMEGKIGFHPLEKQALSEVASFGFIDLYRHSHPGESQFTFWDYRLPKSFDRNLGWRLDHIRATRRLAQASIDCGVDAALRGQPGPSDHTPVWATVELEKIDPGPQ